MEPPPAMGKVYNRLDPSAFSIGRPTWCLPGILLIGLIGIKSRLASQLAKVTEALVRFPTSRFLEASSKLDNLRRPLGVLGNTPLPGSTGDMPERNCKILYGSSAARRVYMDIDDVIC